jgi:putative acetyltransferase
VDRAFFLQSFNALDVALGLYRRMGFIDSPAPAAMSVLARTEVVMNQILTTKVEAE